MALSPEEENEEEIDYSSTNQSAPEKPKPRFATLADAAIAFIATLGFDSTQIKMNRLKSFLDDFSNCLDCDDMHKGKSEDEKAEYLYQLVERDVRFAKELRKTVYMRHRARKAFDKLFNQK